MMWYFGAQVPRGQLPMDVSNQGKQGCLKPETPAHLDCLKTEGTSLGLTLQPPDAKLPSMLILRTSETSGETV